MSWVKIDDGFTDHPKVEALSDRAFRLHVAGLCFCARTLSDGFIPEDRIRRLLAKVTKGMVDELVTARVWAKRPGGMNVVGYLDYNPSKAKVEKERAEAEERRRKWRAKRDALRDASADESKNESRDTAPTHPDPARQGQGRVSEEPSAVAVAPAAEGGATTPETKLDEEQVALNVSKAREARASLRAS